MDTTSSDEQQIEISSWIQPKNKKAPEPEQAIKKTLKTFTHTNTEQRAGERDGGWKHQCIDELPVLAAFSGWWPRPSAVKRTSKGLRLTRSAWSVLAGWGAGEVAKVQTEEERDARVGRETTVGMPRPLGTCWAPSERRWPGRLNGRVSRCHIRQKDDRSPGRVLSSSN